MNKMKVGILTFVNTVNFGASLQAFALQEMIESFGMQAEVIQYVNQDIENAEKNKGKISLKGLLKKFVMGKELKNKAEKFRVYEEKQIHAGSLLTSQNTVEVNQMYDFFITGSDQVWNTKLTHTDWTYFLNFVQDNSKKISYAPSFGNIPLPEEKYEQTAKYLNEIQALSVREASGAELIHSLTGKNAEVVLDPTLLLAREDWERYCEFVPPIKKYILVYFPHDKKKTFAFVDKLKEKTGLPVVYLSISPRKQAGTKTIYDASPEEFLGWMLYADYVVTGSFHGTAFSLNLEKQFFYEPSGKGSRIDNLVHLTGTENRSIDNAEVMENIIDYEPVREKLSVEREKSKKWLKNALSKGRISYGK